MAVKVRIPNQFLSVADGHAEVVVTGESVAEILDALCRRYPPLRDKIFEADGEKRKTVNLYLNREDIRYLKGLETVVKEGDEIIILPPASGG
jgi:molybdopterin synthase sulfur carrier subunit